MQQSHIVDGYVGLFVSTQGDRYAPRRYCLEARGEEVKIIARFTCTFQNIVVSLHCEMSVNTHQ